MKDKVGTNSPNIDIASRAFLFVTRVLKLTQALPKNQINMVLVNQIIRSVTSIGANIEEARGGHTKTDFAHSMNIAKKEARETHYWLKLIVAFNTGFASRCNALLQENQEIIAILTTIVKTSNPRKF